MPKVSFHYTDRKIQLQHKTGLKSFIETIFKKEKKALAALRYIFVSDEKLLEMNRSFLNHDFYTDIITFDLSENDETIGEIYISVDRVNDNASTHSTTKNEELLRVIFHGALHLCGFKDKKKSEIVLMRQKEDSYLRLYKAYTRNNP
jgi:probable rRNA maturation factor